MQGMPRAGCVNKGRERSDGAVLKLFAVRQPRDKWVDGSFVTGDEKSLQAQRT